MENKLTYQELIDKIAENSGSLKSHIHDLLKETIQLTSEGLVKDGEAYIHGLGRFQVKTRKPRSGINPQTGEEITITSQNTLHFLPESKLRDFMNRQYAHLKPEILQKKQPVQPQAVFEPVFEPVPEPVTAPMAERIAERVVFEPSWIDPPPEPESKRRGWTRWWWLLLIALIILFVLLLWQPWRTSTSDTPEETPIEQEVINQPVEPDPSVADDSEKTVPVAPQELSSTAQSIHFIRPGETFSKLARQYYHLQKYWPVIFLENRVGISDPDLIPLGTELIIPKMEGEPGTPTENDRVRLEAGYLEAYRAYKEVGREDADQFKVVAREWRSGTQR